MEDLEICKRIAEIEGVKTYVSRLGTLMSVCKPCNPSDRYNPLTDDALCFQLMVKYQVEIEFYLDDTVDARVRPSRPSKTLINVTGKNTNEAICLAIIKSMENK